MKQDIEVFGAPIITCRGNELASYERKMNILAESLVDYQGDLFAMPRSKEDDLDDLISSGLVYHREDCQLATMIGEAHQCHSNSADLWKLNQDACLIATGYALFDGTWQQHSWLMGAESDSEIVMIVETTVIADCYFGVVLTPEQCEKFYEDNAL